MAPRSRKTQSQTEPLAPQEKPARGRKRTIADPLTRSIRIGRADWDRLDRWAAANNVGSCCEAVAEAIRQLR
jgi:hypothetical protein